MSDNHEHGTIRVAVLCGGDSPEREVSLRQLSERVVRRLCSETLHSRSVPEHSGQHGFKRRLAVSG